MPTLSFSEEARCRNGIGLLFFDLDGTVYKDFSTISERVLAAFDAVKARGTLLAAASGRSLAFMPPPLEAWGGLDFFIGANGVVTYDARTRECLDEASIPVDAALKIMELTADLEGAWLAFFSDVVMREEKSHYNLALEMRRTGVPDARAYGYFSPEELRETYHVDAGSASIFDLPMVERLGPFIRTHAGPIHKLAATFPSRQAAQEAFARLRGVSCVEVAHTAGVEIEVSAAGFTKGASAARLARRLSIPRERTIAFGDAGNDVSFAGCVGRLIAVGERSSALVAVADEVAPSIDQDGVAVWIENHIELFGAQS